MIPVLLALALLAPAGDGGGTLRARFLGNETFEITDGVTTLLTDFPYRSGAFGYMTYDAAEIRQRPRSVCLFTHAHADHFEPAFSRGWAAASRGRLRSSLRRRREA